MRILSGVISSGNALRATEVLERSMDFSRKLDQAQNLSDLFELVKRAVEAVLGRTRAGIMLAPAGLGNHPQGFLGAFYPVERNGIVMKKRPLLRRSEEGRVGKKGRSRWCPCR